MDKEKQDKSNQEPEFSGKKEGANPANEDQTMVALTYDEYDALEKELESLQAQVEEQHDGWLRTRADFENYKKRMQRDAARSHQDALASIVKIYLNIADDLERALKNKPDSKEVAGWINGIELIYQKLLTQIKNHGVERMDVNPGDFFDPNIHEAITQEEHPDFTEGQIIDVVQPGYRISDRIIRPAMVRVAR
jgi:molecular chaperone GrpE